MAAGLFKRWSESVSDQRVRWRKERGSPFENSIGHRHFRALSLFCLDSNHEASTRIQFAFDGLIDHGSCARDIFVDDSSSERREHGERFGRRDHHSRSSGSVVTENSGHRMELIKRERKVSGRISQSSRGRGVAYHIFVSLVISSAHAEFSFGVLVKETLDNFSLVGVSRSDLDVLLSLCTIKRM